MPEPYAVGDTFTLVRECDRYRPIFYAAASGDFNPLHLDPEIGRAAGLGGPILHGLCTMGWATEAWVDYLGDPGRVSRVRVRFSKPVAIGDVITLSGTVTQLTESTVTAELEGRNQNGEVVLKGGVLEGRR